MRNIDIKYNPYRLETSILIDGEEPKQNSKLKFEDCRLQEWIEELPQILFEECSSRDFNINFHGTILDYEDVESMSHEAKKQGININLTHIPAKEVTDKEAAISDIFDEIQAGPFEELKQPDVVKAFNMAKSSEFEVNVVATMSAGKSTLINALLRQKLMPAKQEACTATITEIKDNDDKNFIAKVYDTNGNLIQMHDDLTFEIMEDLNNNPEVSKVRVEGNIPFVSSEDISLVLVDTPGPNNARDPEHKATTYRMLSESSKTVVLYILNATQLAINDDYNLLSHVAESMKVGGKQSKDRFIFVVNKLDDFKKGEDSIESTIEKVREYLRDNDIENANIYPASALTALNIRTILEESDDDEDDDVYEAKGKVRKFNRNPEMHFENMAPLTPSIRGKIEERLSLARLNNDTKEEALIHCGIIPIEMAIQTYVQKYAKTAKIKNIVDTFSKRLESAKSFETIKQEISENSDKQDEILRSIEIIKKKLENGEEAKKFKKKIEEINYDSKIRVFANKIIGEAEACKNEYLNQISAEGRKSIREAEQMCKQLSRFSDNLQAEVKVKLESLVEESIQNNVKKLLKEYRMKLEELTNDINIDELKIDPFNLMIGEIDMDVNILIKDLTKKERVKVDEVWVENTNKKWYKPWTWFQESGHWKDIYEDREYVDGETLSQRLFTPIIENLHINKNNLVENSEKQVKAIKENFYEKFDELDEVLKNKLRELEKCAKDKENIEAIIAENKAKLKWLEEIERKTKSILDI